MPIYEYACRRCKQVFEQLIVRRSDEGEIQCPACSGADVERVMSRPAATSPRGGGSGGSGGRACGPVG